MNEFLLLVTPVADRPLVLPLAVGLASASGFAVSNALQHQVAGTVPPTVRRATAVLGHLARRPQWLAATCISFLAMLCHAAALRLGPITLVQPMMLAGVVLAVPLRAALGRQRPPWPAVRAVGVTVTGLASFLAVADLHAAHTAPRLSTAFGLVAVGVAAAAVLTASGRAVPTPQGRAALLGVAAGVLFGLTAGLLKLLSSFPGGTSLLWRVLAATCLVMVGLMGTALNQRAYQIAPIAFSMPLVNVLDIAVALGFGALVFEELPGHSTTVLLMQVVTLTCVGWGLREIARLEVASSGSTPGTPS